MQAFLNFFLLILLLPTPISEKPATDEFDFCLTRTVKPVCWQCNYADTFFSDN